MRLIDADKLIRDGWRLERHGQSNELVGVKSLADVPTAFDLGGVVEQLEKEIEWAKCHGNDKAFRQGRISGLKTAIRLVKAGGVNEEKIKPCPFCGEEAQVICFYPWYFGSDDYPSDAYSPACDNPDCVIFGRDGLPFRTEEEAIKAWNRRVNDGSNDLDEAIKHARKKAEENYIHGFLCHANPNDEYLDGYVNCGKEHEQLAKWLEELKQYRALGTVEELREVVDKQKNDDVPEYRKNFMQKFEKVV